MSGRDSDVTVVLASFNHEKFVEQALGAVAAQTRQPRLIVTDDGSKDSSVAVIQAALDRLGLTATTIFHARNHGLCATFNEALAYVETPLVAFISADDWMEPTRVEKQSAALVAASEDTALVYGDMFVHDEAGSPLGLWTTFWSPASLMGLEGYLYHDLLRDNFIATPAVMLRTQCLRGVGGYDEELPFEDLDMWLRLARQYAFAFVHEPLVHYRMHPASMSSATGSAVSAARLRASIRIYAKHLGVSAEADAIVQPRVFDAACRAYKTGAARTELARAFLEYARYSRSPRAAVLAAMAVFNIPPRIAFGDWIPGRGQ